VPWKGHHGRESRANSSSEESFAGVGAMSVSPPIWTPSATRKRSGAGQELNVRNGLEARVVNKLPHFVGSVRERLSVNAFHQRECDRKEEHGWAKNWGEGQDACAKSIAIHLILTKKFRTGQGRNGKSQERHKSGGRFEPSRRGTGPARL